MWEKKLQVSKSIRTHQFDDTFHLRPAYNDFRTTGQLAEYNKTLLDQNGINNQVPFQHSNK